jgi:predicted ATPase/DNA-binding SARP family transcriptional activator
VGLEIRVLGPFDVLVDGRPLALGGPRQRAVLALLALHLGQVASIDRIIDDIWGEAAGDTAAHTVQVYVSQLRKGLPAGVIVTRAPGYVLAAAPETLDAERFERLLERGRAALAGDPAGALALLDEQAALWRGAPYAEYAYAAWAETEIARLEELKLVADETRIAALVEVGRAAEAIPQLDGLIGREPLRERLRYLRMLALYRTGRQAEALQAYQQARESLVEQLGIEPGPELQALERAILRQDASLAVPAPAPRPAPVDRAGATVTLLAIELDLAAGEPGTDELARQGAAVREAVERAGGRDAGAQAEGWLAAFGRAQDALAAALELQRGNPARPLRMAIHTGEPTPGEDRYVGLDVTVARRAAAAAHPGQVVATSAAAQLLRAGDASLRDLGEHRLRDVARSQRLHQVVADGLRDAFPPLRAVQSRHRAIPTPGTPLVGRREQVAEVAAMLRGPDARLVTLVGPGGIGKTRLALAVAEELVGETPDGAVVVLLAAVRDPELVVPTIAGAVGVAGSADEPLLEALAAALAERELLLVLDNLEHLSEAALSIAALLERAPGLRILATSRAPLRLRDEREHAVPPLTEEEAVGVFVQGARNVRPGFDPTGDELRAVQEICRRLDHLPLAIELAAPRTRLLVPRELLGRLERRLSLLTGGARDLPERQQTLRAAIDWSYGLLPPPLQALFARLSVFAGGCTIDEIEAVCAGDDDGADLLDGVAALVDGSLLRQSLDAEGQPRLGMLETIREFAEERLEARGERQTYRARHAAHMLELAQAARPHLRQEGTLGRIEADLDNLRAALSFAQATGDGDTLARLAGALTQLWYSRTLLAEGRRWATAALSLPLSPEAEADAAACAAKLALEQGDVDVALALGERAAELLRAIPDPLALHAVLITLANAAYYAGDYDGAGRHEDEMIALAKAAGDRSRLARALNARGVTALARRDWPAAQRCFDEAVRLAHAVGDEVTLAEAELSLIGLHLGTGDLERARGLAEKLVRQAERRGDRALLGWSLVSLGYAVLHADPAGAEEPLARSVQLAVEAGRRTLLPLPLIGLASVAALRGDPARAARLLGATDALVDELHMTLPGDDRERYDAALALAREGLDDESFAAALAEGRALRFEEALALATGGVVSAVA